MDQRGAFNPAGKLDHLLKPAVGNLHLMVSESLLVKRVTAATTNAQVSAREIYLKIIGPHASKIDFYNPSLLRSIDISRWIPQAPGRTYLAADGHYREMTVTISHAPRIR
jgi:hypothetical protein